ncbi:GntR family transcriptional regulator [Roseomonas mucosa]|uniref:GntR family transcriptional regulator n=1 Tax=Roseomonas mucosa TaxID=207340 RepID=UPI0028CC14DA|nr:GntR family transcriptional regulator [Roseomonas mucosa]MDT8277839.1 GntR family transcriptional regulator [Roseomonas mucosa]
MGIAAVLRGEIIAGRLRCGDKLPAITALAHEYRVAPVTIRQAVSLLSDEGLVVAQRGRGTYITKPKRQKPQLVLDFGWPQMNELIAGNKARVISFIENAILPEGLNRSHIPHEPYVNMKRVHYNSSNQPYVLANIYLLGRYFELAPEKFKTSMVLPILDEIDGENLVTMQQCFEVVQADSVSSKYLRVSIGAPLGRIERYLFTKDGRVAYHSVGLYRTEFISFQTTFHRAR